jgi:hypothetical protein
MLLANTGLPHEKACEETCYMRGFASRTSHVVFLHKAEEMASGSEFAGLHRVVPHHMHGITPSSDDQDGCVSEIPHDGSSAGELSSNARHCTAKSRCRPPPCCSFCSRRILPQSSFRYSHHFTKAASIPQFRVFLYYNRSVEAAALGIGFSQQLETQTLARDCAS